MIKFVSGDFFDYRADIRVNTVNCVGVMGAGVALAFKQRYPKMFEEYAIQCAAGRVRPGYPHVWRDQQLFNADPTVIVNFPTKDHWKEPSEYDYIEKGLEWLKTYLCDKAGLTVTLPALGCGHGGLNWEVVRPLIISYLKDTPAEILVFEPQSSVTNQLSSEVKAELEKANVQILQQDDAKLPETLKRSFTSQIFVQGDINLFNNKLLSVIIDSKADEREKSAAMKCIDILSEYDITFLLGFSSSFEVDLVKAVLMKNAKIIITVPYGIMQFKIRKDLLPYWNKDKIAVVSISEASSPWKPSESIKAFKFRLRSANATLITNFDYHALTKFSKDFQNTKSKIFYINYWNDKVSFYDTIGAQHIGKNRLTSSPNLSNVVSLLN